jgi:hypothetical protein
MIQITITFQIILQLIVIDDRKWIQDFQKGTGYDYPDLPGLGNNNEKLGLPERLSTGIQFRFRNLFHGEKIG